MAEPQPEPDAEHSDDDEEGPFRRCIVSYERRHPDEMLRFVVSPTHEVVFDAAGKLPGRGLWLSPGADLLQTAAARGAFAKAAKGKAKVSDDLSQQVLGQLKKRCLNRLGLARRAGQLTAGYEKTKSRLKQDARAILVEAIDGASDGREKMRRMAGDMPVVALFEASELGSAIGRDNAVHVVMDRGQLAEGFLLDATKLALMMGLALDGSKTG